MTHEMLAEFYYNIDESLKKPFLNKLHQRTKERLELIEKLLEGD